MLTLAVPSSLWMQDSLAQMVRIQEIKSEFGSEIREIVQAKLAQLGEGMQ